MASPRISHSLRTVAFALSALAALLVGAAHGHADPGRFAAASSPLSLDAYRLPGGSLPVLCLTGEHGGGEPARPHPPCEACLLSAAHALAPVSPSTAIVRRGERAAAQSAAPCPRSRTASETNRARAPPAPRRG